MSLVTESHSLTPELVWMNKSTKRVGLKESCLKQDKWNIVYLFIVYELDRWSQYLNAAFTLKGHLFGTVKLAKNVDPHKYSYSVYVISFDFCSRFSYPGFDWHKPVFIFDLVDFRSRQCMFTIRKKIL